MRRKRANPAELPIEQTANFEFAVNLKTAKEIGVELPTSILLRADEMIEWRFNFLQCMSPEVAHCGGRQSPDLASGIGA